MIWLASYPRSGNTYFRNILLEVYGISSSDYHFGKKKELDPNYSKAQFVKTHLLQDQLPEEFKNEKVVYLVRDGRDAMVSLAHHRIDIKGKIKPFKTHLFDIILGKGGKFGVSWSGHVAHWAEKADLVIKYEDLIADPIGQTERLRSIMDLPSPDRSKLPTFEKLKKGEAAYGVGRDLTDKEEENKLHAKSFYRKGIAGSYKKEMPKLYQLLFWFLHRKQMEKLKYF